jgi:hypothetical protein
MPYRIPDYLVAEIGEEPAMGYLLDVALGKANLSDIAESAEVVTAGIIETPTEKPKTADDMFNEYEIYSSSKQYFKLKKFRCQHFEKTFMTAFSCCQTIFCCEECHDKARTHMYADPHEHLCLTCKELTPDRPSIQYPCENCGAMLIEVDN